MGKKILAVFSIVAFMVFSYSCISTISRIKVDEKTEGKLKAAKARITKLQKNTGEQVKFSKKQKVLIQAGNIAGSETDKEYSIKKTEIEKIEEDNKGNITKIITKAEKSYNVITAREEGDRVIFSVSDFPPIPISEVEVLWVKKPNTLLSYAIFSVVLIAIVLITGGPFWSSQ